MVSLAVLTRPSGQAPAMCPQLIDPVVRVGQKPLKHIPERCFLNKSLCQPSSEDTSLSEPDPCDRAPSGAIMVSDPAARALIPCMGTLDDRALGLHDEALGYDVGRQGLPGGLPGARGAIAGVMNDVHSDAMGVFDGSGAIAGVCGIDEYGLQARDLGTSLGQNGAAPSRSCTLAAVIVTASSKPSASVTIWRLRPLTFLPASKPVSPPCAVLRVLWESGMAAEGSGARPMRSRHCWRSRSCICSQV